ncbi:MAG: extracellular solute-binding protein [Ruminococcus sp.]|nr:extracellular solute-binding protein [Ruminococcus sp.]
MFKRILAAVMSAAIILALSSCGKDEPKRPEPELTEDGKKIVKMYAWRALDTDIYDFIRNFNARSDEYEVQFTELTVEYGGDKGNEKFNADIAAGNYPDILLYNWEVQFPIESYAQKGMLANLYDFIDTDPDINREDYIENLFKAYETDGKLYKVITSFSIITLAGKSSIVGTEQGISFERLTELVNEYPDKPFETKNDAFGTFITYGYNNYIDADTGVCRFDSEEFISLLEFCNQFPNEFYEPQNADDIQYYLLDREAALLNGTMPFDNMMIDRFGNVKYSEYMQFGEPVTFIGYPGVGGNGSVINPCDTKFSILSIGANPEGAWEFIKYFYSDAYQNKFVTEKVNGKYCNRFPIKKSALEQLAEESKQLVWDSDEKEYVEPYYFWGGKKIPIGVNTDEDNRRIYDLINGAVAENINFDVTGIIKEEAGAYFAGQKSAEDVAEIIQNRVQNYLDENR